MKNLNKLKAALNKQGIVTELVEPDEWISTGIYSLNYSMTGKFNVGIPNRRATLFWGPSGTGKSFLLANAALQAQKKGYFVVYIDSENAAESGYLERIGLDLDEDKFMPVSIGNLEDGIKTMSEIFKSLDKEPNTKIFVAFDSLSMALPEKEISDFDSGELKGDQGQRAKKLKLFISNINAKIGKYDMFFVATGHAYQNQDIRNGEGVWIFSGGKGVEFIPSISVLLTKLKLKEATDIVGVKIRTEITKSRFTKLGGKVEIEVPYETGFDPLSGLLDMAVERELVTKNGAWYTVVVDGEEKKFQRKDFGKYYEKIFNFGSEDLPEDREA